ncbi:MAG: rhodanese-like domain-containing protein [Oleiphilaceae bacterium]|nr:rhodanese-like domain-containing protein [Oleiphilaceae bacterium]
MSLVTATFVFAGQALAVVLVCVLETVNQGEPNTHREALMKPITRDDLKTMNEAEHEDFVLINVLPREEFNKQHIRTSINIPVDDTDFSEKVESVAGGKDRKIVVYSANFDCEASPKAARKLEDAGFTQVYDYEGGTKDWFEKKQAA